MYVSLEMPWGVKHPKVNYWKERKIHIYKGSLLPPELRPYRTPEFSFGRWQEDELNGATMTIKPNPVRFTPRSHQIEAGKSILKAYKNGWSGFLEADKTGLGKGLASSTKLPTPKGFRTMGDLNVGDYVYSETMKPSKIIAKYLSKASKFYKITFSDNSIVYADEDHRWLTQTQEEKYRQSDQIEQRIKLSNNSQEMLVEYLMKAQNDKLGVTLKECLEYSDDDLIKDAVISNPSYGLVGEHKIYHPQEILEALHKRGIIAEKKGSYHNQYSSVKTTKDILDTLLLEDGSYNHSVLSYRTANDTLNNHSQNKKELAKQEERYITKIEEVEKTEEYYCISVDSPSHMYLITESYIPTHNTLSTLVGLTLVAKSAGYNTEDKANLLIVCPKGAIPQWRNTLKSYPLALAFLRPLIINYEQLNKLLEPPATAKTAKKRRTKERQTAKNGKPAINWDYVVADESHKLKNFPKSLQSNAFVSLAELNKPYKKGQTPFTVFVTATPGSSPLNFAVMSQWLSRLIDPSLKKGVLPKDWGEFLYTRGFNLSKGKQGWSWGSVPWYGKNSKNPKERAKYEAGVKEAKLKQRKDALRIGRALKHPRAPFIMRAPTDLEGWPEQQLIPLPLELSQKQATIYEEAWTRFRKWLQLTPAYSDPKGALVETLRYRQKTSLLKVESVIEQIVDAVETGHQVYVSVQFMETLDRFKELLEKKKIRVCEVSGRIVGDDRENNRIAFQKGEYDVVLSTVVENISFHAGESLPDGSKATDKPRVSIIHDVRQNDLDTVQALGRAHRDGVNSVTFLPFFEGTVDEKVVGSFVNKNANLRSMMGESNPEELETLFRKAAEK